MIASRLEQVRGAMDRLRIDGFLVLVEENRRYLSGFTGEDHHFDESAGALLLTADHLVLATDSRFALQAQHEAPDYELVIYRNGLAPSLAELVRRFAIRRLGFECVRVSVQQFDQWRKTLTEEGATPEWIAVEDLVEQFRQIKSPEEIERTRRALALAEEAFLQVLKGMRPGMTEKAVAWDLERRMREAGADALSFPPIVAAGPNSALPHAIPSDRPIGTGEPILFDWGAKLNGYCSDTSRTVILGDADDTFRKVHDTVLAAQQRAIAAIKAGVSAKAVDAEARDFIHQQGFEGKFGHGLGHGTGLAVHEAPRLSPLRDTPLAAGMLVTVEPGIYLPEWGGVRIENQVVVGEDGPIVLNRLATHWEALAG